MNTTKLPQDTEAPAVGVPVERMVRPPAGWSQCCTCGHRWRTGQHGGHSCAEKLREELDITDKLLAERELVLRAIPECPEHGAGCVPYALEWIERAKAALAA